MSLTYDTQSRQLLRGDDKVRIRTMKHEDIPALRQFDRELAAELDDRNLQVPPGQESTPGGPWSNDKWLKRHFEKYKSRGNITLLVEDSSKRIVGFADLWAADEPEPFGLSLNLECIDYFHRYYALGLETVLLQEAEKVARDSGLPAIDIGTNTSSGDYPILRRVGLKVFYEYDHVFCQAGAAYHDGGCSLKLLMPSEIDLTGLVKASHWCPTDFTFRDDEECFSLTEMKWPNQRAVLELWRYDGEPAKNGSSATLKPNRSELYVEPRALSSPETMNQILAGCITAARQAGVNQIRLSCPCDIGIDRTFAFAWMRKSLR